MEMQHSECIWNWWEWEPNWQIDSIIGGNRRIHPIRSDWVLDFMNYSFEVESDDNY